MYLSNVANLAKYGLLDSEDIDNMYESYDPLYHPVGLYTDSNGSDLSIDQRKFQKMFVGNPSQVLQALADEVEDVYSQFVMWRTLDDGDIFLLFRLFPTFP
jgi:hypothetical protein